MPILSVNLHLLVSSERVKTNEIAHQHSMLKPRNLFVYEQNGHIATLARSLPDSERHQSQFGSVSRTLTGRPKDKPGRSTSV